MRKTHKPFAAEIPDGQTNAQPAHIDSQFVSFCYDMNLFWEKRRLSKWQVLLLYLLFILGFVKQSTAQTWNIMYIPHLSGNTYSPGAPPSITTGADNNAFFGYSAGYGITTGASNSFFGFNAGIANTTGSNNVNIGYQAGYGITTGHENLNLGTSAGVTNSTANDNICIGYEAGYTNTGGGNQFEGIEAGYHNSTAYNNFFDGYESGWTNSTGINNHFLGFESGWSNTASYNQFDGYQAGYANSSGTPNLFIGYQAGTANTTGSNNFCIGYQSGYGNTEASNNMFIGYQSGYQTGNNNNTTAADNTFTGYQSGYTNLSGANNSYYGYQAGNASSTGNNNTCVGTIAGLSLTGSDDTYIGYKTGFSDGGSAGQNTIIGSKSDVGSSFITNSAAIGYNVTVSSNNEMVFGNSSVTKWGYGRNVAAGNAVEIQCGAGYEALANGGGWSYVSDKRMKENFQQIDENMILQKVINLPITEWSYIADSGHIRHIGPMAQDFHLAFHMDNDSLHIPEAAAGNIALVAIKALDKQMQDIRQKNTDLTRQNQVMQERNAELQNTINELQNQFNAVLTEVEQLKTIQAQCCGSMGANSQTGSNSNAMDANQPSLGQNVPNPFSQNTIISYYLPINMPNAVITIRSMTGTALQTYKISSSGHGQISVSQGTLAPATYEYDMIVNGKIIDSKKMIIVGE